MLGFSIETILPGNGKIVAAKIVDSKFHVGLSESNKSKLYFF